MRTLPIVHVNAQRNLAEAIVDASGPHYPYNVVGNPVIVIGIIVKIPEEPHGLATRMRPVYACDFLVNG